MAERGVRKGRSLWRDAWKRLRRNRAAMVGLVVVFVMALTAVFANLLIPFQPDYGQPWLRAQPPGFRHPAVLAEQRFAIGKAPAVPEDAPGAIRRMLSRDGRLTYRIHEIAARFYRIRLRRGKVRAIQRQEGALRVERLEVKGTNRYLRVIEKGDREGPPLHDLVIETGRPLPEALRGPKRILLLTVMEPRTPEPETIAVRIEGGRVAALAREGVPVASAAFEGRSVLGVKRNGEPVELVHRLGTDLAGRDVLSRVIYGGRISLMVGAVATLVSVLVGVIYGAVAGYLAGTPMTGWGLFTALAALAAGGWSFTLFGSFLPALAGAILFAVVPGWLLARAGRILPWGPVHRPITTIGEFMMALVDILYALPFMFLVILLMISYGRDIVTLFVALGLVQWLTMARIVRGQALSLKEKEFVEAARMCGTGHLGIIFRHIIPNTLGVAVVYATLTIPAVILQESFLAFIGLTVEFQGRTLDSWGALVDQGRKALGAGGDRWWVLVFPSLAMAVTLFSLNFVGDGLRDALDPQMKGRT